MSTGGFGSPVCSSCGWPQEVNRHHPRCSFTQSAPATPAPATPAPVTRDELLALIARVFRGQDVRAFIATESCDGGGFVRVNPEALGDLRALLDREVPK